MKNYIYLLSGNIDPTKDTDKIHLDMIKSSGKDKPHILLFATASTGAEWHENYISNISKIFGSYNCTFKIIELINDEIINDLKTADIIYFLGGSPYKHSQLKKYSNYFKQITVKAGTSAGAIYLSYPTFYLQKDDYLIAMPDMLGLIDLHVLPHSEMHKEELVANFLMNEALISFARFYGQVGLKIEYNNEEEKIYALMGDTPGTMEKIELFLKNNKYISIEHDGIVSMTQKLML